MFVSDVSDFKFVGKVELYFLSAGEEVYYYKTTMSGFQSSPLKYVLKPSRNVGKSFVWWRKNKKTWLRIQKEFKTRPEMTIS